MGEALRPETGCGYLPLALRAIFVLQNWGLGLRFSKAVLGEPQKAEKF
jgi:hypothetical protein